MEKSKVEDLKKRDISSTKVISMIIKNTIEVDNQ